MSPGASDGRGHMALGPPVWLTVPKLFTLQIIIDLYKVHCSYLVCSLGHPLSGNTYALTPCDLDSMTPVDPVGGHDVPRKAVVATDIVLAGCHGEHSLFSIGPLIILSSW